MPSDLERPTAAASAATNDLANYDAARQRGGTTIEDRTGPTPTHAPPWRWAAPLTAAAIVVGAAAFARDSTHRATPPRAGSARSTPAAARPSSPDTSRTTAAMPVAHPFVAPSHCGIRFIVYGGRNWEAAHPIAQPPTRPDRDGNVSLTGSYRVAAPRQIYCACTRGVQPETLQPCNPATNLQPSWCGLRRSGGYRRPGSDGLFKQLTQTCARDLAE